MTVSEIIENDNIKPDRFGMAAISCIFKAFGDNIRSKEYWPWGDKVNCPWTKSKGLTSDLSTAIELLLRSIELSNSPEENEDKPLDSSIFNFRKRLNSAISGINTSDIANKKINETSKDTLSKISEVLNYE